jgi:hypothetical protein
VDLLKTGFISAALLAAAPLQAQNVTNQSTTPPSGNGADNQAPERATQNGDIVVTARSADVARTGERLRRAVQIYQQGRESFGPAAVLYFQIVPVGDAKISDYTLSISAHDIEVDLVADALGRVTIPSDLPLSEHWRLNVGNGPSQVAFRPLILSPGFDLSHRRIGDLRLQCRVFLSAMSDTMSVISRAAFNAAGGCSGSLFRFNLSSPQSVDAAILEQAGSEAQALVITPSGRSVQIPINHDEISNDAEVRLTFRAEPTG